MPRLAGKKSRKVNKSPEQPVSSKSPPSKLSVRAARLRVVPLQLSSCPTELPSGIKARSVSGRGKATKSTRISLEEGPPLAVDQPAQLVETEEEVCDPATPKPRGALKRNKRKKARKETCAQKGGEAEGLGAPTDSPASREKNEQAHTRSQVPLALASQSGTSAVRRLAFEVSPGRPLPTSSSSEVASTDGAPTRVTRSKPTKQQCVWSAIHEEPQQGGPRSSRAPKQRRLSDDVLTESAKSRYKTKAAGVEAGEPTLESGRGEKAAAQKQLFVATTKAVETLKTVSPQPGPSRKTTKQKVVTACSELLPTASALRITRAMSKSFEEQSSRNAVPGHVKHAKKGRDALESQHLSHSFPTDVREAQRRIEAVDAEVKKAYLEGSKHRRPSAQEPSATPSTRAGTTETSSSRHLPKKNVSWDKHLSTACSSGSSVGAQPTARAHLRSPREFSMRNVVSGQVKQRACTVTRASKQQHPTLDGTQADIHMSREQKSVAVVESQHLVLESNGHRKTAGGSSPTPTGRRETAETSSPQKLARRMSDDKQAAVTAQSLLHATDDGPVTKALSASRNKQSTSIVAEVERSGHASKQQHRSEDDGADDISRAIRRVTVPADVQGTSPLHLPVFELSRLTKSSAALLSPRLARRGTVPADVEGMSPLHIPVFELSKFTKASGALSCPQSAQLTTSAVGMEDSSSSHPLVLESTRISQVHVGKSRDQAEKVKTSSRSSHRQKRQWPAPWDDLLVLDTTREGEKEPTCRNRSPSLEQRGSVSPTTPGPVALDAGVAEGGGVGGEGGGEVDDSVIPWYEKFFGKRGNESGEDDDIESEHWNVDYDESSCHSSDSSLELSVDSDNEVVNAFEEDCKFRKLAKQSDQSKQSHQEAQRLERQRKNTRKRVQQFLSGITLTKGAFEAFEQCEEIMMEHVQKSVEALAKHAGRERVEDLDVITYIQRYLGTSNPAKIMAAAEELLPAEQCRRLFPPTPNVLLSAKAKRPSQR